jgi:site-specific recombinase XerD
VQGKPAEKKKESTLSWQEAKLKIKECMRIRHYSYSTEKTYLEWIERFGSYTGKDNIYDVLDEDVRKYMAFLAVKQRVSASTQNQGFNAILFFFRYVLERGMCDMKDNVRAKRPLRLPVVFSTAEVARIISRLGGTTALMAKLMYGCGLRLNECMRLRVNGIDFDRNLVHIRAAKGDKDRMIPMPISIREELKSHLEKLKELHAKVIQELLGHSSLETTMIYTHVAQKKLAVVESPLDRLESLNANG